MLKARASYKGLDRNLFTVQLLIKDFITHCMAYETIYYTVIYFEYFKVTFLLLYPVCTSLTCTSLCIP